MKKQKNIFVCLLLAVATACLTIPLLSSQNNAVFASSITAETAIAGEGTINDPYTISSAETLVAFSASVNSGENLYSGKYVILTSDIDMSSYPNFTPIGANATNNFRGNFNGQGHTISNLKITSTSGLSYVGLFGYIKASSDVVIQNFTLFNAIIAASTTTTIYGGAVVGFCELSRTGTYNTALITKVAVRGGEIKLTGRGTTSSIFVGGLVGGTSLTNAGIPVNEDYAFLEVLSIRLCYTNTRVSFIAEGKYYYGGVIGMGFANIINSYSLNNPLFYPLGIKPSSNTGLLLVKFAYYFYESNGEYVYWGLYTHKDSATTYFADYVYQALAISYNQNANDWLYEIIDDSLTDGQIIIKNVGNVYEEPVISTADISVQNRYYDITANAYVNKESAITSTLSVGEIFIANIYDNLNRQYLTQINKNYFDFVKGTAVTSIATSTLTIASEHINLALDGYSLYVNYINGYPVSINGINYWLTTLNNNIYKYNESTGLFSVVSVLTDDNLLPTQEGMYFLGWSTTQNTPTCDFVGGSLGAEYIAWHCDIPLVIIAERSNLESLADFTITALTCDTSNSIFNAEAATTLYPVWGDLKFRCYTKVYKVIDGVYTQITNIKILSSATERENYFRLTSGEDFDMSLLNSLNQQILLNNGYTEIKWHIGTLADNVITDYSDAKYGTLSTSNLATTILQSPTFETSIFAVLTPRDNIKIAVQTNEFEGSENLVFKIKNTANTNITSVAISGATELTYGETYIITVEGIPDGWYIRNATIQSANTTFSINSNTCTFTVDSNQNTLVVILDIQESFFTDLIKYTFIGLLVVSLATLFLSMIINTFKPALSQKVELKDKKKK